VRNSRVDGELAPDFVKRSRQRGFHQSVLPKVAARLVARFEQEHQVQRWKPQSIWEVFERLPPSPLSITMEVPHHQAPYIKQLHSACDEELRFSLHEPPQHGKTTTTLAALVYYVFQKPGRSHAYITYNQTRANEVRQEFQYFLQHLGIKHKAHSETINIDGGARRGGTSVRFTSVNSSLTGYSISGVAFVDDPIKNGSAADSMLQRDRAWGFIQKELLTRLKDRLSIVAIMTRWHRDDVVGRLIDLLRWPYLRLPMVCDSDDDPTGRQVGEPLWPTVHSKERCESIRSDQGDKVWEAMYQGNPFPEGDRVFEEPAYYSAPFPADATLRYSIGIDLAYTDSKRADWSVAVRLVQDVATGLIHVDRVIRRQTKIDGFLPDLIQLFEEIPCNVYWFGSSIEGAIAQLLKSRIPRLVFLTASKSKYYRALDVSAAWNDHNIQPPTNPNPHMRAFIVNVTGFTGQDDPHDDDVDALAAAYEAFKKKQAAPHFGFKTAAGQAFLKMRGQGRMV